MCICACPVTKSWSLFVTLGTVAHQAPLSLGFPDKNTRLGSHFLLRGYSQPRDWTCVSCIGRQILYHWATWEAQVSRSCLPTRTVGFFSLGLTRMSGMSRAGGSTYHLTYLHWGSGVWPGIRTSQVWLYGNTLTASVQRLLRLTMQGLKKKKRPNIVYS